MELISKPIRKTDYRLELIESEILLYNPSDIKIISLNQTASLIWQLCTGQATVAEMIEALKESYPEAADEIEADVLAILNQFEEVGCINLV